MVLVLLNIYIRGSGNYLMVGLIDKTDLFHVERVENRGYKSVGEVGWELFIEKMSSVCDE